MNYLPENCNYSSTFTKIFYKQRNYTIIVHIPNRALVIVLTSYIALYHGKQVIFNL